MIVFLSGPLRYLAGSSEIIVCRLRLFFLRSKNSSCCQNCESDCGAETTIHDKIVDIVRVPALDGLGEAWGCYVKGRRVGSPLASLTVLAFCRE